MPLIRIDIFEGWEDKAIQNLSDVVQEVMISHFAAPVKDKYQVIHEHKPGRIRALDTGLGFERTDKIVIIQITQQGRTVEQKQKVYIEMCRCLETIGIEGTDLVISIMENTKQTGHLDLEKHNSFWGIFSRF
jgi:phenylpyruvate tautomerase PptA (4-oxalocrotonate tautomerase family)